MLYDFKVFLGSKNSEGRRMFIFFGNICLLLVLASVFSHCCLLKNQ